jgi:hypothetical protein
MKAELAQRWLAAFYAAIEDDAVLARLLRDASLASDLKAWTAALTVSVVRSLQALDLLAAAKGHRGTALPLAQEEYLGQDVMAFAPGERGWRLPVAVFELENSADDQRVAYSLWKTLAVRASLRVVFCYRQDAGEAPALVSWLADQVIAPLPVPDRTRVEGTTLLTVGSRAEAATFPYGFFQSWKLSSNTGRFERFTRS